MDLTDKQLNRLENGREYRNMVMEIRAADNEEQMLVEGYATTFNQPYMLYDGKYYKVIEQIAPTAFQECDMADVIMQYNHEGRVFARNKNGTLSLTVDNVGLKITADLGGTDIGRRTFQALYCLTRYGFHFFFYFVRSIPPIVCKSTFDFGAQLRDWYSRHSYTPVLRSRYSSMVSLCPR